MINRILMELYDDYKNNKLDSLIDFANKTFPNDGTNDLFIGSTLILFSNANGFKARYDCTRENLLDIVLLVKEKSKKKNLMYFYVTKVNNKKIVSKYLKNVINSENIETYADIIIEYLEQFKPKFMENMKEKEKNN